MNRVGLMHLIDTLDMGGAERVAVNIVNALPRERYRMFLCATRRDGPLAEAVSPDVARLSLHRKHRLDTGALRYLIGEIRQNHIQILHAHSTSLFVAAIASMFPPFPKVVWHDHFGRYAIETRPFLPYWLLTRRVKAVISVSRQLAEWSKNILKIPGDRVFYMPNFVHFPKPGGTTPALPGKKGFRIVCVANLRPEKDHLTLLRAMAMVVAHIPEASLLLVGSPGDARQSSLIQHEITTLGLDRSVFLLGQRNDVYDILGLCDIGILSSVSEGLPLALIEYGMAGLAVVATETGQCPEVLDKGRGGILVPPGMPAPMAGALVSLLQSPEDRSAFSERLHRHVDFTFTEQSIVPKIVAVYDKIMEEGIPFGKCT